MEKKLKKTKWQVREDISKEVTLGLRTEYQESCAELRRRLKQKRASAKALRWDGGQFKKQKEGHCGWKVAAARGRVVGDDKRGQESDPGGCCGAR